MCPICKNMMKKMKSKRGGEGDDDEEDIEMGMVDEKNEDINEENDIKNDMDTYDFDNEEEMEDKEYIKMDAAEKGQLGLESVGGKRRRKERK